MEFDDERSGEFEPLKYVSENKEVVLDHIIIKHAFLEKKKRSLNGLKKQSVYSSLSPQCGFASCKIGNKLTKPQQ